VTGAGLAHLKHLSNLESLILLNTNVGDDGLVHLQGLTKLHTLNLSSTPVTPQAVQELEVLLPNCRIDFTPK
jgi:hypothetical protein